MTKPLYFFLSFFITVPLHSLEYTQQSVGISCKTPTVNRRTVVQVIGDFLTATVS